ncbi:MAG: ATP-dependent Clp protease ATP-binding subunit, partial [Acidobacteriota bacterium]|nr:ATP-dependent Clp protease ATP-binding subunit [Acidobacteriota bacterium]
RFDMSEFMEKHSVSKLIGSPPGYVGYEEGGQLTERVKRSPYSIILLDEIEKAHPDIFNILLQVFEDGQLTDGLGNQIDFKNTIIIMTSNLGARFLEKRGHLGFQAPALEGQVSKVEDQVKSEVKRAFNPEFLNRLDDIILFQSLTDDDLIRIMDLLVEGINKNLEPKQIKIRLNHDAAKYILEKTCTDRSYGARPLRRALQKYIEDPLSEALIQGVLPRPSELDIYLGETGIFYRQAGQPEQVPVAAGDVEGEQEPREPGPGILLYTF